jgi:hypothetical protein
MKTPCCKKEIREDDIWNLIEEDTFGVTSKDFICPYCKRNLICFLEIESIELDE